MIKNKIYDSNTIIAYINEEIKVSYQTTTIQLQTWTVQKINHRKIQKYIQNNVKAHSV